MIPVSSGKEQGEAELPSPMLGQVEWVHSLWGSGCLASYLFALVPASGLSELACHRQRFMWTSYVWRRLLPLAGDSRLWGISPARRTLSKIQGLLDASGLWLQPMSR